MYKYQSLTYLPSSPKSIHLSLPVKIRRGKRLSFHQVQAERKGWRCADRRRFSEDAYYGRNGIILSSAYHSTFSGSRPALIASLIAPSGSF